MRAIIKSNVYKKYHDSMNVTLLQFRTVLMVHIKVYYTLDLSD